MLHSALNYTHELLKTQILPGDTAIDATVGNGGDTLLLAQLVGDQGVVVGFDIQKSGLETTQQKLEEMNLSKRTLLHNAGHEDLLTYYSKPDSVSAIVFNLGYLPKGDKTIVTTPSTTIKALESSLYLLKKHGLLLVMVYYGHEGGLDEKEAVLIFLKSLPQKYYSVLKYEFLNQKNHPPFLLAVEKR